MAEAGVVKRLVTFSDGGARGNPGPAAIGVVIFDETERVVAEVSEYIGEGTNNQAEYRAVIAALERAIGLGATHVVCYLDSELVVRQLTGKYKVKNEGIVPLFAQALRLTSRFSSVNVLHVAREKNAKADALVNRALDRAMERSCTEPPSVS